MSDTYHLTGAIDDKAARKCLAALRKMNDENPTAPWIFTLSSVGGDMAASTAIYSELNSYSIGGGGAHHVITRARGQAASGASLIFQAGDRRLMGKMDSILLHEPRFTFDSIPMTDVENFLNDVQQWVELYLDVHLERVTHVDRETMRMHMALGDWVIYGGDAVLWGFADALG